MPHASVSPRYQRSVGIASAAPTAPVAWMDAGSRPTRAITIAHPTLGATELPQRLRASGLSAASMVVVRDATGTYGITRATHLVQAGFAVRVIHPAHAHAFAQARLTRAKTDAIDAQTRAERGARVPPIPWTPPPAVYAEWYQRLDGRDGVVDGRTHLRTHLHALIPQPTVLPRVRTRRATLITTVNEPIAALERAIAAACIRDDAWAPAAAHVHTIPGVGGVTAGGVLVAPRPFSLCPPPETATRDAGLAPHP